jgi:hypothetical protein
MMYVPNIPPELFAPGAGALNKISESLFRNVGDIVARRRAELEQNVETGRQRELERWKAENLPTVTGGELTPEEEYKLQEELGGTRYTHDYADYEGLFKPRRPKEVALFNPEDLAGIREAREQSAKDRAAAEMARLEMEYPFTRPIEVAREQGIEYQPTTIGPKGTEYSYRDYIYGETEPFKAETSRISATRPRATGGGGGGTGQDKLLDPTTELARWANTYMGRGMEFGQGLMGVVDNTLARMQGATTEAEVMQALNEGQAAIQSAQQSYETEEPGKTWLGGQKKKQSPEVTPEQAQGALNLLQMAAAGRGRNIARTGEYQLGGTEDVQSIVDMY